jgi:hypothetical protein
MADVVNMTRLAFSGDQLVWWDHNSAYSWREPIVCPECGRSVGGTLVRESDHDGDRAQCADCWRRDGATDR